VIPTQGDLFLKLVKYYLIKLRFSNKLLGNSSTAENKNHIADVSEMVLLKRFTLGLSYILNPVTMRGSF
jgi:hypothetical protein